MILKKLNTKKEIMKKLFKFSFLTMLLLTSTLNIGYSIDNFNSKKSSKSSNFNEDDAGCTFNENNTGSNVFVRSNIVVNLEPGECSANVTLVTPTVTGASCNVTGPSNGTYPIGTTQVEWTIVECPDQIIRQNIVVNNFQGSGIIACNDLVQVSLDDDCYTVVTPDQILEGGSYGCYDYYTVEIYDENTNISYGNVVTEANIGQTLTVKVTDQTNNSCWGKIAIEDKNPTPLNCRDAWTRCNESTLPGALATRTYEVEVNPNVRINEGGTSPQQITEFNILDDGLNGFTIGDMNIALNISHPNVSELRATLSYTSPEGDIYNPISLFDFTSGTCTSPNISLTFDDESASSYASLLAACGSNPAKTGTYNSQDPLSSFDTYSANGMFTLRIYDNVDNASNGTLVSATITFTKDTNIITFPGPDNGTYTLIGENTYTTDDMDACGSATINYNDVSVEQECTEPYSHIITRTWYAEDEQGNNSSCVQTIYVYRNDLSDLTFPKNYDNSANGFPALSCRYYGETVPTTAITGVPTGSFCDNVQIFDPVDTRIDICELSYKIVRHWKVADWCSGEIIEHDQIIKIEDTEGPVMDCPANITIAAGDYDCSGAIVVDKPVITRECSSTVSYKLFYGEVDNSAGIIGDTLYAEVLPNVNGEYIIDNLVFGKNKLKWQVEDDCNKTSECTYYVTVVDLTPPFAVCDQFTVTSIGADGWAVVKAETFDDGSTDNCGITSFRARKVTNICTEADTQFGDEVRFCCEEVGTSVMVEYEVQDAAGNSNTCMVEVRIQDKLPPYITYCPADITLNCQSMDITNLDVTGRIQSIDNCGIVDTLMSDSGSLDQCGRGVFTRVWKVTDNVGLQASCVQTITVIDSFPFTYDDITWPDDYSATSNGQVCDPNLDPSTLDEPYNGPILDDDFCSLTASTYEDQVFYFVEEACVKIIRTWSVIDWCTYDAATGEGIYTQRQILKVSNTTAPTFTTSCGDREFCIYGDNCSGEVSLSTEVTDDCTPTPEITVTYEINSVNSAGDFTYVTAGSGLSVTTVLVPGDYHIEWQAEDHCGNVGICQYNFVVKDCKAPTPYCHTAVTSVVMNNSGSLTIWANDFDLGSYDNCTSQEDLRISFSSDVTQTNMTFTCNNIPDGESNYIEVEMWVTDLAGNQDFCTVHIDLQDNNADACSDLPAGFAFIKGNVRTASNKMVSNVEVDINSNQSSLPSTFMTTAADGGYSFSSLPHYGNYSIKSSKNDDLMNGVSTLDLVLIQKHILGLQVLDTPYKLIAADINANGGISAIDLIELRKLILGVTAEFPSNTSWRFIPEAFEIEQPTTPWDFPESVSIESLYLSDEDVNFLAVKTGDVNKTASLGVNSTIVTSNRSNQSLVINQDLINGESIISLKADQDTDLIGLQFALNIDPSATLVSVESGALTISADNYRVVDNTLILSWNDAYALDIKSDDVLLQIKLTNANDLVSLNDKVLQAEAYNNDLEVLNINVVKNTIVAQIDDLQLRNSPNPFVDATQISFNMMDNVSGTLSIYDANGKIISVQTKQFNKGLNTVNILSSDLAGAGLYVVKLDAGKHSAVSKMIVLQ